jgi:Fur family ferric uptake transcriptional regulator
LAHSITELLAGLRQHGVRLTIQRRLVLEVLCEHEDHLGVHDIQQRLREQGTDLNETTVYRILQWLKAMGLVSQTDMGQRGIVYQVIGRRPHHHLICLHCGAVIDVDDGVMGPLAERLRNRYGFEPRIDHMAIYGTCRACQENAPATSDDAS